MDNRTWAIEGVAHGGLAAMGFRETFPSHEEAEERFWELVQTGKYWHLSMFPIG